MRKVTKLAISFGSAALILGGGAFAQLPTLGSTTLDANGLPTDAPTGGACNNVAAGAVCSAPIANEAGFMQREVRVGTERFIQTIINDGSVDQNATGQGFASEDFVRFNNANTPGGSVQGIMSQLTVRDAVSATNFFQTTSDIQSGWAVNGGDARAVIDMEIRDDGTAGANLGFQTLFSVDTSFNAATNTNTLNALAADQTVGLGGAAGSTDKQRFYTEIKQAANAGSSDLATVGAGTVRGNGATWAAGEVIQVVWAGQQVAGTPQFGTQTVTNVTANNAGTPNFTSLTDLAAPGPWLWNAEFNGGVAPTF